VDRSNVQPDEESEYLALLPADADASAAALRARLAELTGVVPAVVINDSHGRAWRIGTVGVAIGCAGLPPLWNQRGLHDLFGYELDLQRGAYCRRSWPLPPACLWGRATKGAPSW
jgi:coenzyme F420-0:L-glutamate ligase/coenzyme F420-1:gamma-L-glutamate ligase